MFLKSGERCTVSLRGRLVLFMFLASGLLSIFAAVLATALAYRYMIGDEEAKLRRLTADLQSEYAEFGGLTQKFVQCVQDDVEEHDPDVTFVMLTDATNGVRYATAMPMGYETHLLHMLERGRLSGRFYAGRDGTNGSRHGAVRYRSLPLADGCRIALARDITPVERFLIRQAIALGCAALLITICTGLLSYFAGGRILKLNRIVEEKDRAYAELRRLTDDIAHDLRTPLTRLSMAAETDLAGGCLAGPLAQQVMHESGAMLELINTMLEISQTEARIDRTPREELDLASFVRRAGELYEAVAEDAGVKFVVKTPAAAVLFSGHKGKLQQLIANLVENAFKFTPRGGRIEVSLTVAGERAELAVADTGSGMSSAEIPLAFTRFWRADTARHLPGNGLGLALVKAIATSYGGGVSCVSDTGRGSTFTVTLPLQPRSAS